MPEAGTLRGSAAVLGRSKAGLQLRPGIIPRFAMVATRSRSASHSFPIGFSRVVRMMNSGQPFCQ